MASTDIENQNLPMKGWHGLLQMQDPNATGGDFNVMNTIGWVASVSLEIGNSSESYFAIGDRVAKQTRRGQVELSGSIGRAFIDSSLIRLMFGRTEDVALINLGGAATSTTPLNMKLQIKDESTTNERIVIIELTEVIIESFSLEYGANDNIMENVDYQAGDMLIHWDGTLAGLGSPGEGEGFEWSYNAAASGNLPDLDID